MGCGPKRRTNLRRQGLKTTANLKSQIKRDPTIQKFRLDLLGVECKFCARAAVELLEQVPGVILAEYICDNSKNFNQNLTKQARSLAKQDISEQFGPGEISSMLDIAYSAAQTGKKSASSNSAHKHDQVNQLNKSGVNNFPGFVNLYYKPREDSQLSSARIKQMLNSDGFELEFMQLS